MPEFDPRYYRRSRKLPFWTRTNKIVFAGVVVVCLAGVIFGEFGLLRIVQLRGESSSLQAQIVDAKMKHRVLEERKISLENDLFVVEKLAREQCGLYKPGEKIFLFDYGDTSSESSDQALDNFSLNQ